ncbi:MAG: hypothetical protein IJ622_07700 [Bacteroidales bacterium]|nr:hypothetical protein [Bacteroidales bacterium]
MKKLTIAFMAAMMFVAMFACKRDVYGDVFINRDPVTFRVQSEEGQPLSNVSLKTEELDGFDYGLIVNGTHYAYTDVDGMATVDAARNNPDLLGESRTTRFTFTATDYSLFDTIFNSWEGTIDIVLHRE